MDQEAWDMLCKWVKEEKKKYKDITDCMVYDNEDEVAYKVFCRMQKKMKEIEKQTSKSNN